MDAHGSVVPPLRDGPDLFDADGLHPGCHGSSWLHATRTAVLPSHRPSRLEATTSSDPDGGFRNLRAEGTPGASSPTHQVLPGSVTTACGGALGVVCRGRHGLTVSTHGCRAWSRCRPALHQEPGSRCLESDDRGLRNRRGMRHWSRPASPYRPRACRRNRVSRGVHEASPVDGIAPVDLLPNTDRVVDPAQRGCADTGRIARRSRVTRAVRCGSGEQGIRPPPRLRRRSEPWSDCDIDRPARPPPHWCPPRLRRITGRLP